MKKSRKMVIVGWSFIAMMSINPTSALCKKSDELLFEKANSNGRVRVIVQLNVDYKTEGKLSSVESVAKQRDNIAQSQKNLLDKFSGQKISGVKKFKTIPHIAMEVDADILKELIADPDVINIEEDVAVPPVLNQSVPFIKADQVHASGYDGTGWNVAVLDTGVRKTHEFLSGKVVSEACYSTTSGTRSTTLCPGGTNSTAAGSGVNCSTSISSGCSHGTHVAGIISGKGGATVAKGVAPGAKIIAIQVFSKFNNSTDCGSTTPCVLSYTSDQLLGLERVYALRSTYKIAAVNMSLGGGKYSGYCDADSRKTIVDNLRSAGIATVISSGNDYYDGYVGAPGCISSAVTVGATIDNANTIASYSNHANMVDLMAPGSSITSSIATSNTSYATWDGTSMAAPHVAGAFAVMKSKNGSWTVNDIEMRLQNTGASVARAGITKQRIDLLGAVNYDANILLPAMSVIDNVIIKQ